MGRGRLSRHTPKTPAPILASPASPPPPPSPTVTSDGLFRLDVLLVQQWYTKIVDLPNLGANPAIDPNSGTIIGDWAPQQGNFLVPLHSYTIPTFRASATTPRVDVTLTGGNAGGAKIRGVPLEPSWQASSGTDAQLCVIDPVGGCMYDYYRLVRNATTGAWSADYAFGNPYPSPGGWPNNAGARASGLNLLLGMIRPDEIAAGLIPHAIGCAVGNQMPTPQTPTRDGGAYTSAGSATSPHGVPDGARFRLKPSFSVGSITDPRQRIVATAFQNYGGIAVDGTGAGITAGAADPDPSFGTTWSQVSGIPSGAYWYLDQIPLSSFEVLLFTGKTVASPSQSAVSNACTNYGP